MRNAKWFIVWASLVMLLSPVVAVPALACDGGACGGKCEGKCGGDCGDDCKCKGKGECTCKQDPPLRYSDPLFLGFEIKLMGNGLPVVSWVDETGFAEKLGFKEGDILLSMNGREIREFPEFLKDLDSADKEPIALRILRNGRVEHLHKGKCGGAGFCKGKREGDGESACPCKGKCEGDRGDACPCKGKCEGCRGDACPCKGKCEGCRGDACPCKGKCECPGDEKSVVAPNRISIQDILGITPLLCDDGTVSVKGLLPGKTGAKMGLRAGDVILAANGVDVTVKNGTVPVLVSPENAPSFLILRGKRPLRICGGRCDDPRCDSCNGRCGGGGGGCSGCGGGCR